MNNKQKGSQFEREFCEILKERGYWVHFIAPSKKGSQPCDVIAVKKGVAYLIDCKTSVLNYFPVSRLELNQIYAYERWLVCGNKNTYVAVKYNDNVYMIDYEILREKGKVALTDELLFR